MYIKNCEYTSSSADLVATVASVGEDDVTYSVMFRSYPDKTDVLCVESNPTVTKEGVYRSSRARWV